METFIDKLAQRLTAQEMIKANAEAEARELSRLQAQVREYQECLDQMRQVGEKLQSDSQLLERLHETVIRQKETLESDSQLLERLHETVARQEEALESQQGSVREMFVRTDENVHRENVKVYRNVQAVVVETAEKQKEYLCEQLEESTKTLKSEIKGRLTAVLTLSVLALLASLGSLAFQILTYLGIL